MRFLITYDIRDYKRRCKVFKLLKNEGLNVQLSCFEVDMKDRNIGDLLLRIQEIIDRDEDSVYCFPISKFSEGMMVKFGKNEDINESKVI